jgi:hypothetical protein
MIVATYYTIVNNKDNYVASFPSRDMALDKIAHLTASADVATKYGPFRLLRVETHEIEEPA